MKYYRDRFLFILIVVAMGIFVIPLKYLSIALIFTGEKIDDLSDYLANLSYANFINRFIEGHLIDANKRRCKKKNDKTHS